MISESWRRAEGVFIPKEDGATSVDKFRTISLMNVEGKLYFALRADRLLHYTLANKYIDTSIQKGGYQLFRMHGTYSYLISTHQRSKG